MPVERSNDAAADAAMERYAAGEASAFEDLYDQLAPRLYGYLLRQTHDFARAEDLVQQTMVNIHGARGQFVRGASVVPWAFAIARRQLIDATRRAKREALRKVEEAKPAATVRAESMDDVADDIAHAAQLARMIRTELDRLPEEQRVAFELVDQEGLSQTQAAEVLGTTVTAIKRSAQKTYATLRLAIGEWFDETPPLVDASADLKTRILRRAEATPARLRRTETIRSRLILGTATAASLVTFIARGGIRLQGRPLSLMLGTTIGTGLVAGFAMWAALGRGRSMLGRPRAWLLATIVASPIALVGWKVLWSAQFDQGLDPWPERLGFKCLSLSLALGALPLLAVLIGRRGSEPRHPRIAGGGTGASVGLAVAVFVDMWCPVAYVPHFLLGHVLPIAVLGLIGFSLGTTLLALPSRNVWMPRNQSRS